MKIKEKIVKEEINIEEDIEITQNTVFEKNIRCRNIISIDGRWDINAGDINAGDIDARDINARDINAGDIDARDIDAWDINARDINAGDIDAWDINARDIDAWDINARDITAWDIICEKRIKKSKDNKTIARIFIENKSKLERKEW